MKSDGIRIATLFALSVLWLETSYCAESGSPTLGEEISKQERIIRSEGERTPEGYTIDRGLSIYTEILHAEFDRTLANLGPADRWLDIGAGQGLAILEYYSPAYDLTHPQGRERRGKKARAVAMSIEDRRTPLWHKNAASLEANQIEYLVEKRLNEYSLSDLGQFRVISDVIGGFSYSVDLAHFMEKALAFLQLDGSFYTVLQDVKSEDGKNRPHYANAKFLTEITNATGSEVSVCSWLKSIACVSVTCEFKTAWRPPVESYRVHKVCNEIKVPPLQAVRYEAGTPPERQYQLRR